MRRRDFIKITTVSAVMPLAARAAPQKAMPVVGILAAASSQNAGAQRRISGLREAVAEAGFVDGKNVAFEYRWAETHFDRLPGLAAELVARKVDVIATEGGDGPALAARQATSTIPIVCILSRDPVAAGFAESLQRPGRNVTGVTLHGSGVKRFEIVSELLPEAKVIAYLVNPKDPSASDSVRSAQQAAQAKVVQLQVVEAGSENDIEPAFANARQSHADALLVQENVLFSGRASQLASSAAQHKLPTIFAGRPFVESGGLLGYSPDFFPAYQSNGRYVARILKGEKAGDLPLQQPTKFILAVNMNAANALGLAVPQSILARADIVIK
jgi:putative ABC transport system substrate-binding protein